MGRSVATAPHAEDTRGHQDSGYAAAIAAATCHGAKSAAASAAGFAAGVDYGGSCTMGCGYGAPGWGQSMSASWPPATEEWRPALHQGWAADAGWTATSGCQAAWAQELPSDGWGGSGRGGSARSVDGPGWHHRSSSADWSGVPRWEAGISDAYALPCQRGLADGMPGAGRGSCGSRQQEDPRVEEGFAAVAWPGHAMVWRGT